MTAKTLRFSLTLDHHAATDTPMFLTWLGRLATDRRHGVSLRVDASQVPAELIPDEAVIQASWQWRRGFVALAEASEYLLLVEAGEYSTLVRIAASRLEVAQAAADRFATSRAEVRGVAEATVWFQEPNGASQGRPQDFAVPSWQDIAPNYPTLVASQLEGLIKGGVPAPCDGRLLLFHGEAGTGKTTAIRALIDAWAPWCAPHVVTDPDRMLANSSYLLTVLDADEPTSAPTLTTGAGPKRWKLVIAEDADAYLRSTARHDAGAALGRLLNITDGLLSQSTPVLVLLTTNEPTARLHPAITRPGRCLAQIEFTRFDQADAKVWLGGSAAAPAEGATLAELYELRRRGTRPVAPLTTGAYL